MTAQRSTNGCRQGCRRGCLLVLLALLALLALWLSSQGLLTRVEELAPQVEELGRAGLQTAEAVVTRAVSEARGRSGAGSGSSTPGASTPELGLGEPTPAAPELAQSADSVASGTPTFASVPPTLEADASIEGIAPQVSSPEDSDAEQAPRLPTPIMRPGPFGLQVKRLAVRGEAGEGFGARVALSADGRLAVAAALDARGEPEHAGRLRILERGPAESGVESWRETSVIEARDGQVGDRFGSALLLDGAQLLVGAEGRVRLDVPGRVGAVVVLSQDADGAWRQLGSIRPDAPERYVAFGAALARSGDNLAIGAPGTLLQAGREGEDGATDPGRVFVYRRGEHATAAGGDWQPAAALRAREASSGDRFGQAIAMDGGLLLVGAPGGSEGPGAAELFVSAAAVGPFDEAGLPTEALPEAPGWLRLLRLEPADGRPGDGFGQAVALQGDRLIIAAPFDDEAGEDAGAVYVYELRSGSRPGWQQTAKLRALDARPGDRYGSALSLDGDRMVVGAPGSDLGARDAGAVFVNQRPAGGLAWIEAARLWAGDAYPEQEIGGALSASAGRLLVGARFDGAAASGAGAVYLFETGSDDYGPSGP